MYSEYMIKSIYTIHIDITKQNDNSMTFMYRFLYNYLFPLLVRLFAWTDKNIYQMIQIQKFFMSGTILHIIFFGIMSMSI
ncbi:hypothetical protein THRCLA_20016 [Thraustotheca clavata]|uniref:Uncharacterized protein n=1 Tax=Thraustotheca clavata TaxID=74557 RepID=A0A1W0ACM8_9STRA|nr:hypothetical protein THRCLA_20016 [Thraustotheca clavata]